MKEHDNHLSETISTLIDGEDVKIDAAVGRLSANERSREQWQNYHLIRDALLDELPERISIDFSERVMSAIDDEPTVFAPNALKRPFSQMIKPFAKPFAGAAIAATVAAVTVISVQSYNQQHVSPQFQQASTAQSLPSIRQPAMTAVAAAGRRHIDSSDKVRWEGSQEDLQEVLNDYLMTHTENAHSGQIRSMMPYARLAGFNGKTQ